MCLGNASVRQLAPRVFGKAGSSSWSLWDGNAGVRKRGGPVLCVQRVDIVDQAVRKRFFPNKTKQNSNSSQTIINYIGPSDCSCTSQYLQLSAFGRLSSSLWFHPFPFPAWAFSNQLLTRTLQAVPCRPSLGFSSLVGCIHTVKPLRLFSICFFGSFRLWRVCSIRWVVAGLLQLRQSVRWITGIFCFMFFKILTYFIFKYNMITGSNRYVSMWEFSGCCIQSCPYFLFFIFWDDLCSCELF